MLKTLRYCLRSRRAKVCASLFIAAAIILLLRLGSGSGPVTPRVDTVADPALEAFMAARSDELARTTGAVTGKVVDSVTGLPLKDVHVSAQYLGDSTDEAGMFELTMLKPGAVTVSAFRTDLLGSEQVVNVSIGKVVDTAVFRMEKAPGPCCRLAGEWNIALTMAKGKPFSPGITRVNGTVDFSVMEKIRTMFGSSKREDGEPVAEWGRYDVDLRPFFGEDFAAASSSSRMEAPWRPGSDMMTEVSGAFSSGNAVRFQFIPQLSHGGLGFSGVIGKDGVIRGEWVKRDFGPGYSGTFTMTRSSEPVEFINK